MQSLKFIPKKVFQTIAFTFLVCVIAFSIYSYFLDPTSIISKSLLSLGVWFLMVIPLRICTKGFDLKMNKNSFFQIQNDPLLQKLKLFENEIDISKFVLPKTYERVLAFLIDRTIALLLMIFLITPVIIIRDRFDAYFNQYSFFLVPFMVMIVLVGASYAYVRDAFSGQSIARRILKMRVIDSQTHLPIGGWKSFKRELLLHFAPTMIIEFIMIVSREDKRRLGDRWAKTIVVKV